MLINRIYSCFHLKYVLLEGQYAQISVVYYDAVSGSSMCMGTVTGRIAAQSALEYYGA